MSDDDLEHGAVESEAAAGVADEHRVGIDHTGAFVAGRRLRDDAPTEQSILPVTPPRRLVATWLWMSEGTEWERETISKIRARQSVRNQQGYTTSPSADGADDASTDGAGRKWSTKKCTTSPASAPAVYRITSVRYHHGESYSRRMCYGRTLKKNVR